ncbi:ankyrin repeat domain-containing protein [Xenorhabdus bovienii]|uniref:ankyrin repeat domain-containing protein n=1 Tax=Xenorhabdus bovienii TaxID=40576 RepID=UPI00237CDDCA|nr:ankyrin repeat domain-containing protein [Xenorhabdus bovienii]MDE1481296.1 ankyrin repeat domain-containing protein [Xenorhabdus bovienii]MDE9427266.1 ankyrin repeat domain-containing protein [Xenorhabdus bovienii]MDE9461540.1 ankyrin repeat domain-containing protein [Xenorhabdus bovienii]MDE9463989.1 ankyrin repeat domain-containing protein [Xenorhabdus bovienii]MDE9467842.1 ankyrin repeat domain-containing protein [Xenorhabdus bovienii]
MKKIIMIVTLLFTSVNVNAQVLNENNPDKYKKFRLDYVEMVDLANPERLSYRVFYEEPSTGENSKWFDAIKQGDFETVKKMVESGQDIEAKDTGSLNQTALGWATFIGYEDIVDYLISKKANLWATDTRDVHHTLKSAVLGKNTNIVKKIHNLMKHELDLNDQTIEDDGETPVMIAASNNRIETVKYLIEQGANLNLFTITDDKSMYSYDQSALTYACERNLEEMQKLLIKHGALNHKTHKPSCN